VIAESGAADPLLGMLAEADEILSQAKLRNREAIRQANRQVRVGAARLSPHIVIVVADSVGHRELGCYGAAPSLTPQLDRLAANGMRFSNYYAASCQSEAGFWSLMTGRNASRAPRTAEASYQLRESQRSLADVLWNAGYTTSFLGVWTGAQRPTELGFDDWVGRIPTNAAAEAFPEVLLTGRSQMRIVENANGQRKASFASLLAAEAEAYLDRNAKSDRPFLLVVRLPSAEVCQFGAPSPQDRTAALKDWDDFVGRLSARIDEHNLRRRVCVMFTALTGHDSAESPSHPLRESSLRAPLIVSWVGGVPRDAVSDHVCTAWDVLPTCVELARVSPAPDGMDGISFSGSLRQQAQKEHPLLFWESRGNPHVQAVRKGQWKGVYVAGDRSIHLFNLQQDPGETTDVAEEHPDVVKQLIVRQPVAKNPKA